LLEKSEVVPVKNQLRIEAAGGNGNERGEEFRVMNNINEEQWI